MTIPATLTAWKALVAAGPLSRTQLAALRADPRPGAQRLLAAYLRDVGSGETELRRLETMLQFEREAQAQGFTRIAGVDEAGRGPLAGPIVAAAVVLAGPVAGLNDSKLLTHEQREILYETLQNAGHAIAIAVFSAAQIDQIGIQQANYGAMATAVAALEPAASYVLVDGFKVPGLPLPQLRLIKGDQRSLSIAAASIIAKVHRDRMMDALDRQHPEYGFARHKGYGTKEHLEAIARFGPCPAHRMSFAPLAVRPETGSLF